MAFSGSGAQAASSPFTSTGASSSGTPSGSSNSPSTSRPTPSQRASSGGNAFAPKRPSTLSNSFGAGDSDADGDAEEEDGQADEQVGTLHTIPPAFGRGGKRKWVDSGRSLGVGVGGSGGETVLWVRKKEGNNPNADPTLTSPALSYSDQLLITALPQHIPQSIYEMYAQSAKLFEGLQQITHFAAVQQRAAALNGGGGGGLMAEGVLAPPQAETVKHIRSVVGLYRADLRELAGKGDLSDDEKAKWAAVHQIFELAEILFLPQDGQGEGLICEELLNWVNEVELGPDNVRGAEIMRHRPPSAHPNFWPYLHRCILRGFFVPAASILGTLSDCPHSPLADIGTLVAAALSSFPRSNHTQPDAAEKLRYPVDHLFLEAHERWLSRFQSDLAALTGGPGKEGWLGGGKEWEGVEKDLRLLIELMEGNKEKVLEQSETWREALGAWGLLVQVDMSRDEVPAVTKHILATIPPDPSSDPQLIQSLLCSGETTLASLKMYQLDTWLAAHLGDVLDKMLLLVDDESAYDISLRNFFLLEYAELLQGSTQGRGLWKVVSGYLVKAGKEGKRRLGEHLMRVGLQLGGAEGHRPARQSSGNAEGMDVDAEHDTSTTTTTATTPQTQARSGKYDHMSDVLNACRELGLERERHEISRVIADQLIRQGEYGVASAMCMEANDVHGIGKLADRVVEVYIRHGAAAYLQILSTLPPSLLSQAPAQLKHAAENGHSFPGSAGRGTAMTISTQLSFLGTFRDYLMYMQQGMLPEAAGSLGQLIKGGIAPRAFWGVLLGESVGMLEVQPDDPNTQRQTPILFNTDATFDVLSTIEAIHSGAQTDPEGWLGPLADLLAARTASASPDGGSASAISAPAPAPAPVNVTGRGNAKRYEAAWEKLEAVRLACARNLAATMVYDLDHPGLQLGPGINGAGQGEGTAGRVFGQLGFA